MPTRLAIRSPGDFVEFQEESILQGIHERFEEQARLYPANVALKTPDAILTYAETNGLANSIAAEMLATCGKKLAQAAILLPNTTEMIIAILAALKAHKAYVPLDPNYPQERLKTMLKDSEASILLTDEEHIELARELAGKGLRILNTSRIKLSVDADNLDVPYDPLDRAYILYTSGSTGKPKGIAFLHRNLLHSTACLTNQLFFAPSDRVTWLHSASFAASVVDIYCCLTNGGALYPWDVKTKGFNGMADWLVREKVTTFQWIPSAFRQFLRTVPDNYLFPDMRIAVMASEPLTVREVELFRRHFPAGSHLVNQVGTSESYNYRLYAVDHGIPIEGANVAGGYSVSGDRQVLILDDERRELPRGSVGEIGIRSDYMSAGYWRDAALTKSKFVRIGADGSPVYLTGDLGKLEKDGCLIHMGRKDSQVKIRGYRVELAEVEFVLSSAPGVADSAVWVVKNHMGEDQLVGYVVRKADSRFSQKTVEKRLESRLPEYMVPHRYVILGSLPTLPTGKVDRKALPNPFDEVKPARTPAGGIESASIAQAVEKMFAEILQLETVGPDTNIIERGCDSLTVANLTHRIHQHFKVEIALKEFTESPTPRHVASLIEQKLEDGGSRFSGGAPGTKIQELPVLPAPVRYVAAPKFAPPRRLRAVKDIIIVGAGRMGRETYTWAEQIIADGVPLRIKGFLDSRSDALKGYYYATGVLGDVESYRIGKNDVFIGAVGDPRDKVKFYSPILKRGGQFINLIHPLANVGRNVRLGAGVILAPFTSVVSDVSIGSHVSIGTFTNVGHDAVVGNWCQISSHCGINGAAKLGDGVFLGSHTCVIPDVTIGGWAFTGAGSIVVKSVQPCMKVFGNPAVPIGRVS
jgi:sugar O-acyltransferase (sialic acid O-acetyltransferase NeuD family)